MSDSNKLGGTQNTGDSLTIHHDGSWAMDRILRPKKIKREENILGNTNGAKPLTGQHHFVMGINLGNGMFYHQI